MGKGSKEIADFFSGFVGTYIPEKRQRKRENEESRRWQLYYNLQEQNMRMNQEAQRINQQIQQQQLAQMKSRAEIEAATRAQFSDAVNKAGLADKFGGMSPEVAQAIMPLVSYQQQVSNELFDRQMAQQQLGLQQQQLRASMANAGNAANERSQDEADKAAAMAFLKGLDPSKKEFSPQDLAGLTPGAVRYVAPYIGLANQSKQDPYPQTPNMRQMIQGKLGAQAGEAYGVNESRYARATDTLNSLDRMKDSFVDPETGLLKPGMENAYKQWADDYTKASAEQRESQMQMGALETQLIPQAPSDAPAPTEPTKPTFSTPPSQVSLGDVLGSPSSAPPAGGSFTDALSKAAAEEAARQKEEKERIERERVNTEIQNFLLGDKNKKLDNMYGKRTF